MFTQVEGNSNEGSETRIDHIRKNVGEQEPFDEYATAGAIHFLTKYFYIVGLIGLLK